MSPPNACRTARLLVGALSVIAATAWCAAASAQDATAARRPPPRRCRRRQPLPPVRPRRRLPPPPPPPVTRGRRARAAADAQRRPISTSTRAAGRSATGRQPGADRHRYAGGTGDRPALLGQPDAGHRRRPRIRVAGRIDGRRRARAWTRTASSASCCRAACRSRSRHHRHVSFQVIPVRHVRARTDVDRTAPASHTDFSGMRVEVGARTGFELFFGFIGIPELALSATVGLQFETLQEQHDERWPDPERHDAPVHDDRPEQSLGYLRRQRRGPVLFLVRAM